MHIRQTEIATLVAVGKAFVVNAQEVKNSGVEVVHVHGPGRPLVLGRLDGVSVGICDIVGVVVGLPIGDTGLYAAARHPDGEATGVVIASVVFPG